MKLLRAGDWRPGGVSPALLAIQLLATFQVALRGLDYLGRDTGPTPPSLRVVESAASPAVWGGLLFGSAVLVLIGLAGRWPSVLITAHLLVGATYVGLGWPVVVDAYVGPPVVLLAAVVAAVAGVYAVACPTVTGLPTRFLGVGALAAAALALSYVLDTDYRTGTGLVIGGLIHAALALGVWVGTMRRRLAPVAEQEHRRD